MPENDGGIDAGAAVQGVVACAAGEGVVADQSLEQVGQGVAGDEVVQFVAYAEHCGGAGGVDEQPLDVVGQDEVGDGEDGVGTLAGQLDDRVAQAHLVRIVAGAADEHVGSGVVDAGDEVAQRVAGAADGLVAKQREVLHVSRQRVGDVDAERVGACACGLGDHVAWVVDGVAIVACAAGHGVGAGAAIEGVVAGAAGEGVVAVGADEVAAAAEGGACAGGHWRGGRGEHRLGGALGIGVAQAQAQVLPGQGAAHAQGGGVAPALMAPMPLQVLPLLAEDCHCHW